MVLKYNCKLCNKDCASNTIGQHLRYSHPGITAKIYYDKYLKTNIEGICRVCGKPTKFISISCGYKLTCCKTCSNKDIIRNNNIRQNLVNKSNIDKKTILEKRKQTCLEKYGVETTLLRFSDEEQHNNSINGVNKQKELSLLNPEYYSHPDAIIKRKQTCLEKYGYTSNLAIPENIIKNIETKRNRYDGNCHSEIGLKHISDNMTKRMNNLETMQSYIDIKHKKYNGDTCSIEGRNNQRKKVSEKTKIYFNNSSFVKNIIELKRKKYNGNTISESGLTKLTHNIYSGKYKYDNIIFDSSWELAYYIWLKDHNINFEYHTVKLEYYINNNRHLYFPDFKINNQLIEIKSNYILEKYTSIEKLQCMLDNSVNIITKTEIKPYLLYCKTKNINLQEFKIKYV